MRRWTMVTLSLMCAACLFAGLGVPALAQEGAVTVDTARPVTDVIGEKNAYLATVSPDGNYIAWGKQSGRGRNRVLQLCLYEFESAGKQCSDLSPDVFDGYPYQFQWSPDSSSIAFTENPIEIGAESDIWLFDVEAGTFTDLTDDGLVGTWSYMVADGDDVMLDILPMWNTADALIYFWRVVPLGNMRFTVGIYSISPEGGDAELVRDLTTDFADRLPLYNYQLFFLDGPSALSPDGSTLAMLMSGINEVGATSQELYTLDLTDTSSEPQLLASGDDWMAALPEWAQDFPPQAQGLSWTADGTGLVTVVNTALSPSVPFQVYYYTDLADGSLTPVVDFSSLEEMDDYTEPAPGSDLPWRVYSPWTGSLSPEGNELLMVNDIGGTVALLSSPLPPTGDLPAVSASSDESPGGGAANSSRGAGGKVIAYSLLLTITEE